MNNVRIESPPPEDGRIKAVCGTRIFVDGVEQQFVREASIILEPSQPLQLTMTKYLSHLVVKGGAEVREVTLCPLCQRTVDESHRELAALHMAGQALAKESEEPPK